MSRFKMNLKAILIVSQFDVCFNITQETKKRRPSSARKFERPAQKKKEKGTKDAGLLTPDANNCKDNADNAEDPEKLYQVTKITCSY